MLDGAAYSELAADDDALAGATDLLVFDRVRPTAVPLVNSLSFAAAPPLEGLELVPAEQGSPRVQRLLDWDRSHPLMQYVALHDVPIESPGRLRVPAGGRVLATGLEGPAMAEVGGPGATRHVAVAFDPRRSRWPLEWSFQVFIVNTLDTLGVSDAAARDGLALRAGEPASIRLTSAGADGRDRVTVSGPDADVSAVVVNRRLELPPLDRAGWWEVGSDVSRPPLDRLPVSVLSEAESALTPASILPLAASAGGAGVTAADGVGTRLELWPWLLTPALALLLIEWGLWARRV